MIRQGATLWREAQALVGDGGLAVDVADPLEVIEQVMRYFYAMGVQGVGAKAPVEDVQKCFQKALNAASLAAPYRHPRLSAVKNIDNNELLEGVPADATPEELRAVLTKRIRRLIDEGYVDLEALPPPEPTASA
jgi:hypothetical protein